MAKQKSENTSKGKLVFLGVIFTLIIMALFARVVYITTVYGQTYERRAIEQDMKKKMKESVVSAKRGNIYDRNKKAVAVSYAVDNVIIDIVGMVEEYNKNKTGKEKVEKTITALSENLNIPESTIKGYLATDENGVPVKNTRYFVLAKNIDRKVTTEIKSKGAVCVYTEEVSKRYYPDNNFASQVIGFLRGDTRLGLERQYDKELSGISGKIVSFDKNDESLNQEVVDGYSLVTTIDSTIQKTAERLVKENHEKYPSKNTAIMVMNPNTGEVIAMAQYPPFNLNDPANINEIGDLALKIEFEMLSDQEKVDRLSQIWTNFNVSFSYEPGSIYKPLVVAEALEENVVSLNTSFFCGGYKVINDRPVRCVLRSGHGNITLTEAIAKSCNVAMMEIADKLGANTFYKYHNEFGFGQKTGVDLPGEADIAKLQYSLKELERPMQIATSSFGQGFNATPIQSLTSFAAVINGGNLIKPYAVSQIIDDKGNVIKENTTTVRRKVLSEETSRIMRTMLQSVVSPNGTGRKVMIDGYAIGGKSGTAEQGKRQEDKSLQEYALSFVSFFPADNPEYIAIAIMDRPIDFVEGVTIPAPMMKELINEIIQYKGIMPTVTETEEGQKKPVDKNSIELEDLTGATIVNATKYFNSIGLDYEIIGAGDIVSSQSPTPGTIVTKDTRIFVYAQDSGETKLVIVPKIVDLSVEMASEILLSSRLVPVPVNDQNQVEEQEEPQEEPTDTDTGSDSSESEEPEKVSQIVIEQMPTADTRVPEGTEIKIKLKN